MNPPLTFANALIQLKLLTSQTANFTFTDDELTQALQSAWNDTFVCDTVWDSSLTYVDGTWQYTLPATVTRLKDIYFKRSSSDNPEKLSKELYEVVAGKIQFNKLVQRWLSDTYTLYLKGMYKLTTTNSLDTDALVNYTLSLAAYILLKQLSLKKTFFFLKTDTTMADIINARRDMQSDVLRYKQALLREFESS